MFRKPPDIDLSSFLGQALRQVCFGEHQIQLHFDDRHSVMCEVDIEIRSPGEPPVRGDPFRSRLLELLSVDVAQARFPDEKTLLIECKNGTSIAMEDDSEYYESFQTQIGERLYVI